MKSRRSTVNIPSIDDEHGAAAEFATRSHSTVATIVFTDIVDSTALWESLGIDFRPVKDEHDRIVRRRAAEFDGVEANTTGDGFLLVFQSPQRAIDFAIAAVVEVSRLPVPRHDPLKVRIGLHTGELLPDDDGSYDGPSTNLAARVCAAARPNQILISENTVSSGATARRLGSYRLKGIGRPITLFQIEHPSLPRLNDPTPNAASVQATHLPYYLTPFLGRQSGLAALANVLAGAQGKCISITGASGIGKTRLTVRAAEDVAAYNPDGVRYVGLGAARSTRDVYAQLAQEFELASSGASDVDRVHSHVAGRRLLLILDDVEAVEDVEATIADLLSHGRLLTIAVCSTLRLKMGAAINVDIGPLAIPDRGAVALERVAEVESVAYLIHRAAQSSTFRLSTDNAQDIAELCRLLDGIPLALELAAPWLSLMTPKELTEGIASTLDFLASDYADLPTRQRTLRASIDWVYARLSPSERSLFEGLSLFAGGFTLEAVRVLFGFSTTLILKSLSDKSLILREPAGAGTRYRLPSLTRLFAAERLATSEDADRWRERYAGFYAELASKCSPPGRTAGEASLNATMREELDNMIAAVDIMTSTGSPRLAEMSIALARYHRRIGLLDSAARFLDVASGTGAVDAPIVVELDNECVSLLLDRHRFEEAAALAQGVVLAAENVGDASLLARSVNLAGLAQKHMEDTEGALAYFSRARNVFQQAGDQFGVGMALCNEGLIAYESGGFDEAERWWREALSIQRTVDDRRGLAETTTNLGNLAEARGNLSEAWDLYREALAYELALGDLTGIARSSFNLAGIARSIGQLDKSSLLFASAWQLFDRAGSPLKELAATSFQETADALGLSQGERQSIWMPVRDTPTEEIASILQI